jgi:pimeloyl-ACP methyl ester carboxylesterase
MATYCSELSSVKEATIVHSKSDKVLPIEGARKVAASSRNSTLIEFENLGHYSILWSDELGEIVSQKA